MHVCRKDTGTEKQLDRILAVRHSPAPRQMTNHPPQLAHPKYRPDIDGLRGISVLAVVGYHAFPNVVTGGFVGVDIFFVISGFLISTILFTSLDAGSFSFAQFYARRIRRIFPALFVLLVSCFTFGWFALLADEYKRLGKHIAGGAGFVSNYLCWSEAGYFDDASETKPLLHLWSLGIEEQFYIVWPLFLWTAWRFRFNLPLVVGAVASISFVLNVAGIGSDPVATFYSPQSRFWEISCGSLLAWRVLHRNSGATRLAVRLNAWSRRVFKASPADDGISRNALSILGIVLISFAVCRIEKNSLFPGIWALLPVLGAVLVISAGPRAWFNRAVLSNRLLVWFGLISFPLYLWHWSILSFARIAESETPAIHIRLAGIVLSVGLAWLTYAVIENPIRSGANKTAKTIAPVLLMGAIGYIGYETYNREGLPFRRHASLQTYAGDLGHDPFFWHVMKNYSPCANKEVLNDALTYGQYVRCMQSKPGPQVDILLLGDSHAEQLLVGLAEQLPDSNVAFYIRDSFPRVDSKDWAKVFNAVVSSSSIKTVVLTMNWLGRAATLAPSTNLEAEVSKVAGMLANSGKRVFLAEDVPSFPFSPERCKGKRWGSTKDPTCSTPREYVDGSSNSYRNALRNVVAKDSRLRFIEVGKYICDSMDCSMVRGNELLYRDYNHLNLNGSRFVGSEIVKGNPDLKPQ